MLQWRGSVILLPSGLASEIAAGKTRRRGLLHCLTTLPQGKNWDSLHQNPVEKSQPFLPNYSHSTYYISIEQNGRVVYSAFVFERMTSAMALALYVILWNKDYQAKLWQICPSFSILLQWNFRDPWCKSLRMSLVITILGKCLHFNKLNFTDVNQPFVCKTTKTHNLSLASVRMMDCFISRNNLVYTYRHYTLYEWSIKYRDFQKTTVESICLLHSCFWQYSDWWETICWLWD